MTGPGGPYATIDDEVAEKIRELHKRYPKLGHHGLLDALRQSGIHVEAEELERFMEEHKIRAEKPWRPWRWRGLPAWMGGAGERPDEDQGGGLPQ